MRNVSPDTITPAFRSYAADAANRLVPSTDEWLDRDAAFGVREDHVLDIGETEARASPPATLSTRGRVLLPWLTADIRVRLKSKGV